MLIVFEGQDSTGKTTTAIQVVEKLNQLGHKAIYTV